MEDIKKPLISSTTTTRELPGFRFHPTEEELLNFYLRSIVFGKRSQFHVIGFLNIYRYDPRDLPGLAKIGEREWYFFVPRDRKQSNGGRPNRTTEGGFWKATGSDRKVVSLSEPKRVIGYRKTLVFYNGRAPRGTKTDWVMNEYRLPDNQSNLPKDVVLCKVYRKATSLKVLEEWAAKEEKEGFLKSTQTYQFQSDYSSNFPSSPVLSSNNLTTTNTTTTTRSTTTASASTGQQDCHHLAQPISSSTGHVAQALPLLLPHLPKKEEELEPEPPPHQTTPDLQQIYDEIMAAESIGGSARYTTTTSTTSTSLKSPFGIPELQVPGKVDSSSSLWVQDIFGPQLRSPFLDIFNLFTPSPNLLI